VTVGTLFTGIGGFDLGFERAGFEIRWQVELDAYCRAVLARHFPKAWRYRDVRFCVPWLRYVDVICAGWPCQPVSSASRGRRLGTDDHRWLWPATANVLAVKRPAWFVGENVTHLDGAPLEQVVSDLEALGYEVAPPLEVPACAFGHDHWRPRLWILGHTDRNGESGLSVNEEMAGMPLCGNDAGSMGTADGISRGLDARRMSALGNALIPQIAQWIAERIKEAEG
jgi:DNA (cytosine-5)-methyltransferase 1